MDCPWCDGDDTERIGAAGSLLMTEQWFCRSCDSPFEVIRKRGTDGRPRRGRDGTSRPTTTTKGPTSDVDAGADDAEDHDHRGGRT